ncbi:hypothetical protein ACFYP4_02450 [Streptomyces sp. NPDC005551]|uniref:hypothetical protein n=1 Tax=Streptomyces sp. NPDC005551 TaxID=3364725 RepID=UPI0036BCCA9F
MSSNKEPVPVVPQAVREDIHTMVNNPLTEEELARVKARAPERCCVSCWSLHILRGIFAGLPHDSCGEAIRRSVPTVRTAQDTQEMISILKGMEGMEVVRDWKVEATPEGDVTVSFTSITGRDEVLSAEAMRGYSKGFATAFRFFTERP